MKSSSDFTKDFAGAYYAKIQRNRFVTRRYRVDTSILKVSCADLYLARERECILFGVLFAINGENEKLKEVGTCVAR